MSIFFSLCYVVIGGLFAARLSSPTIKTRIALFLFVGGMTYLVYDQIRDRATAGPDEG
jgi:surface polysaccharide O-acyltransferase-like enzyme